ncbi:acyltransferase [Salmonella enterica]|nr:acyltransferase [Salmonella enterica]EAX3609151.1 acyltransferase [Salmonella enterica]EGW6282723.1 acyltransferase [Salmonella enterica]EGX3935112.1 acyltransferase [Salmonella enterica]
MQSNKYLFAHYLRGLAAITVIFAHYGSAYFNANPFLSSIVNVPRLTDTSYPWIIQQFPFDFPGFLATFGVCIFFMISGFVIPISIEKYKCCMFLIKRFFRLFPTYLFVYGVNLLVALMGYLIFKGHGVFYPFDIKDILSSSLIGINTFINGVVELDPVAWTLAIEILFYFTMAVVFNVVFKLKNKREIGLFDILMLSFFLNLCVIKLSKYYDVLFPAGGGINGASLIKALFFISVMLLGTSFYLHAKGRITARALFFTLVAQFWGIVYVSMHMHQSAMYIDSSRVFSWIGITILVFSFCYFMDSQIKEHKVFGFFGDISYPLYLCHSYIGYLILGVISSYLPILPRSFIILLPLPFVVTVAWYIHKYVEMPSSRFLPQKTVINNYFIK